MARAMYDYTIQVLQKVSFSTALFCKELNKAEKILLPFEFNELLIWLDKFISNKPELSVCMTNINLVTNKGSINLTSR